MIISQLELGPPVVALVKLEKTKRAFNDRSHECTLFIQNIIVSFSHVPFIDYFFGDSDEINLVGFLKNFPVEECLCSGFTLAMSPR